jgi:transposase
VGPYIASVREHLAEADGKIVFDKFHVAKHLGDAVDKVRRRENKTLKLAEDDRLAGTRYDWLRNPASMEPKNRKEFAELRNSELKTARASALKETAMAFTSTSTSGQQGNISGGGTTGPCEVASNRWIDVARMFKRSFENIITHLRHRITNASGECHNANIQWVKYTARGFRNRQNFVHAIYFHCGGLDLAPESTK